MTIEPLQFLPESLKHPLDREDTLRKVVAIANLNRSSHALDVGPSGFAALYLARSLECPTVVTSDQQVNLLKVGDAAKALFLAERVTTRLMEETRPPFAPNEFAAIFVRADLFPLQEMASRFREGLGLRGRLWATLPLKIGRYPSRPAVEFWEQRLGRSVLTPKDALLALEQCGFEPEAVQTTSDSELADFYRELERALAGRPEEEVRVWRQEIELFRTQSGKASVAYGWVLARRKEPGEKPPQSRERG